MMNFKLTILKDLIFARSFCLADYDPDLELEFTKDFVLKPLDEAEAVVVLKETEVSEKEIPRAKFLVSKNLLDLEKYPSFKLADQQIADSFFLYERKGLKKILIITTQTAGVYYYRLEIPYTRLLEEYPQFALKVTRIPPSIYSIQSADLIIIQRLLTMTAPGYELGLIRYAHALGKKVVYETDDLEYEAKVLPQYTAIAKIPFLFDLLKSAISSVDLVIASTPILADNLRCLNPNVRVLENHIDLSANMWRAPKAEHEGIHFGWAGGSTHYYDMQIILRSLRPLLDRVPNSKFVLVGYDKRGSILQVVQDPQSGGLRVVSKPLPEEENIWFKLVKELETEIGKDRLIVQEALPIYEYGQHYKTMDVVLIPLGDSQFHASKSCLKLLEAGAYSLPVVCSDVPPYNQTITHKVNGFLASKPKHWIQYGVLLASRPDLRKEIGESLNKLIREKYSSELVGSKLAKILVEVLNQEEK